MSLEFWLRFFGVLSLEAAIIIALAAILSRYKSSTSWQRTIWQTSAITLALLVILEASGLGQGLFASLIEKPTPRRSPTFIVQTFPATLASPGSSSEMGKPQSASHPPLPAVSPTKAVRTWWPGAVWLLAFCSIIGPI